LFGRELQRALQQGSQSVVSFYRELLPAWEPCSQELAAKLPLKKKPATLRRRRHKREESGDLGRGRRPLGAAALGGK
jgi:hypothetical protein